MVGAGVHGAGGRPPHQPPRRRLPATGQAMRVIRVASSESPTGGEAPQQGATGGSDWGHARPGPATSGPRRGGCGGQDPRTSASDPATEGDHNPFLTRTPQQGDRGRRAAAPLASGEYRGYSRSGPAMRGPERLLRPGSPPPSRFIPFWWGLGGACGALRGPEQEASRGSPGRDRAPLFMPPPPKGHDLGPQKASLGKDRG